MTRRSNESWTIEEEIDLCQQFNQRIALSDIAEKLGRSELAIIARLSRMKIRPAITTDEIEKHRTQEISSSSIFQTEEQLVDVQRAFHRFHFVYGIINSEKKAYIGYSKDVWRRIGQHNNNKGAVATKDAGPWYPFLIYCFASEKDAKAMETKIQRYFSEHVTMFEISIIEVLAQIGVPVNINDVKLLK